MIMNENFLTLSDLALKVKSTIERSLQENYLVVAEILSISVNRSGHAYLELIEKNPDSQAVISQFRATIWASKFRTLKPYFETSTSCSLASGIKIMVRVNVNYHILYGLSLNILDIMPEYTIGEMALQRKITIEKLKSDGVFDMNKSLELKSLVQRIAVISSSTAAGYGDFLKHLSENSYGFKYSCKLFEAFMQGETAAESMIEQLDNIFRVRENFDCVVIIRGGGGKTDLSCFDSYSLCQVICQFPLPIITGIGHDRDSSIADLVAFESLKTPTAVSQFFIDRTLSCYEKFKTITDSIKRKLQMLVQDKQRQIDTTEVRVLSMIRNYPILQRERLEKKRNRILSLIKLNFQRQEALLKDKALRLSSKMKSVIDNENHNLQELENKIKLASPETILKKGYAKIESKEGKTLSSVSQVSEGQEIITYFYDGKLSSIVKEKIK